MCITMSCANCILTCVSNTCALLCFHYTTDKSLCSYYEGKFTWDNGIPRTSATGAGVTDMSDANWPKHYAALLEFVKERGHSNIPTQFMYTCDLLNAGSNGRSYHYRGDLGQWLALQRRAKAMRAAGHNSGLLPEREALLQRLVDEGHLSWSSFFGAAGLTQREVK